VTSLPFSRGPPPFVPSNAPTGFPFPGTVAAIWFSAFARSFSTLVFVPEIEPPYSLIRGVGNTTAIHPNLKSKEVVYILNHSGASLVLVETVDQWTILEEAMSAHPSFSNIKRVVVIEQPSQKQTFSPSFREKTNLTPQHPTVASQSSTKCTIDKGVYWLDLLQQVGTVKLWR